MAFVYKKSLNSVGMPALTRVIIDNSDTIQLGDAVRCYNAGNVEVAAVGKPLAGIVHMIVTKNNTEPSWDSSTTDTVTVASDNETVAQIAALIDMNPCSIYSTKVTGTIGTTATSDKLGVTLDVSDETGVTESTASRSVQAGVYSWGVDPEDSTRLLVSIMESEIQAGGAY